MSNTRRIFLIQSLSSACALTAFSASSAFAQAPAAVLDTDAQALALGYKTDGSKTDKAKYPNYAASQSCSGCVLFQGKASDSTSPCAVFGGKLVSGKGWCSVWAKKA